MPIPRPNTKSAERFGARLRAYRCPSGSEAIQVEISDLLISDMGLFANPENAIKLTTLHNSKGREFDAVTMICTNNGSIPHFSTSTQNAYDEARRLYCVGLTRAKRVLVVASD